VRADEVVAGPRLARVGLGATLPRLLGGGRQLARDHPANGSHELFSLFVRVARTSVASY
jgi:hypothetical protein